MVRLKPDGPEGQRQAWGQGSEPGYISHGARGRGCCRWRGCENTALVWESGRVPGCCPNPDLGGSLRLEPVAEGPLEVASGTASSRGQPRKGRGRGCNGGDHPIAPLPPPAALDLRVRRTPGVCFPALPTKLNNLAWTFSGARPHFPCSRPKASARERSSRPPYSDKAGPLFLPKSPRTLPALCDPGPPNSQMGRKKRNERKLVRHSQERSSSLRSLAAGLRERRWGPP